MEIKPQIRYLHEMKFVIYDKDFAKSNPDLELYYIYRGVEKQNGIRYDITVIPPRMLGQEFVRTKGNRNSDNFAELYIVLEGEALFLMQKSKNGIVEDIIAIKAKKADYVLVPADHAVIIINASKKELKTGNWVSEKNENIYEELEKMEGMCYFYTREGWIKNKNYKKIPKLKFEKPLKEKPKDLGFLRG